MATYDTHLTVSLVGVLSLGLNTHDDITVTDTGGAGDSSSVLGDVAADHFTAPTGLFNGAVDYTYLGTVRDADGKAVGFAASSGLLSALIYTVFLPSGVDPTLLSLTLLPQSAVDEQSRWDVVRAAAVDATPPATPTIGTVGDNAGFNQGMLANGASTDDTTLTLAGTAEVGATVRVYNNGSTLIGTVTAASNGTWTLTTPALPEGAVSLTAKATDAAGNISGASTAFMATIDTLTPTVLSVAASGSGITAGSGSLNTGTLVTLTMTVGEAVIVTGTPTLALNSGGTATYAGGSGTGTLTFTYSVADGQAASDLTVTGLSLPGGAFIRDAAGNNLSFVPASVGNPAGTLRIDTSAPAAPATLALAADTGSSSADRITADPTLTGVAEAGATIVLKLGSTVVGTGTADAVTGAFSITPSGLAQGANTVVATATDAAGNTGLPTSFTLTYDNSAPGAPAIGSVVDDVGLYRGNLASGATSDDDRLDISGAAEAGAVVRVFNGSVLVGSTIAASDGKWTLTTSVLPEGAVSLTTTVTDAAGNLGPASAPIVFTLDRTAPTSSATLALVADTGTVGDGITANPALTGTAPANASVIVKDGNTVVATLAADATGKWTFANAGATEGAHSYTATVADAAGNLGPASAPIVVTLDRTAPFSSATLALVADTGTVGDGITANPALTGTISDGLAGQMVTIHDAATIIGMATTGTGGSWTFANAGATEGAHSYTATVIDVAGNLGPASAAIAVTFDTTVPYFMVFRDGAWSSSAGDPYVGPVAYLQRQFIATGQDEVVIGNVGNDFINLSHGTDAANGGAGDDVLDGGTGSNFLTGGAGFDVFFLDGRGGQTTWSTITDWQAGEHASLFGWRPGISKASWVEHAGTAGYEGVTLHADINEDGSIETSLTWSGLTQEQLPTPIEFDDLLWFK